jgi:[NiFe] hydrogenase assembly HybE family chaperone
MTGRPDPSAQALSAGARLADYYCTVHGAMRDLPVCNPRLEVEAVGFRAFGEYVCGVVLTPWFMNLIICGAEKSALPPAASGAASQWRFLAGDVEFIAAEVEGFGLIHSCSLFSPMDDFADHAAARATALAVLDALFAGPSPEPAPQMNRRAMLFGASREKAGLAS